MSDLPGRVVPNSSSAYLSDKQLLDYETHRRNFIQWLTVFGKDPDAIRGYAESTVINTADRGGRFDRWVWERENGMITRLLSETDRGFEDVWIADSIKCPTKAGSKREIPAAGTKEAFHHCGAYLNPNSAQKTHRRL